MKTFEEIAPLWAAKLKDDFKNIKEKCRRGDQELDMTVYECCIVGEAHGFNEDYTSTFSFHRCRMCKDFAKRFDDISDILNEEQYEIAKEQFVKHWNEKHK